MIVVAVVLMNQTKRSAMIKNTMNYLLTFGPCVREFSWIEIFSYKKF